jgi:hypothetical protein
VEFLPTVSPENFWFIAFALWAWDAKIKVIPGSKLFKTSLWRKEFTVIDNPIGAFGNWFSFANPLEPFTITTAIPESSMLALKKPNNIDKWIFERCIKPFDHLAIVSGLIFLVLFLGSIILSMYANLLLAILVTLLISYALMGYQFFWLWRRKGMLGLTSKSTVSMLLHCLLFPPYGANFARAVFARTRLSRVAGLNRPLYFKRNPDWMAE